MKLASLLVPAYLPRAYVGATPTPYQSGTVDAFERALVKLCPALTVRHHNSTRLHHDPEGRFVAQQIVTRYDVQIDPTTTQLGDVIDLALATFKIDKIEVIYDDAQAATLTADDAAALKDGLHDWNGEFPANE